MLQLTFMIRGDAITRSLSDGNYIMGRTKACDIVAKDKSVSGQHIRLDVEGDSVFFRDLLSRNGTFLNGEKVDSGYLRPNDTLRLGKLSVKVTAEGVGADANDVLAGGGADDGAEETPPHANFVPALVTEDAPQQALVVASDHGGGAVAVIAPKSAALSEEGSAEKARKLRLLILGSAVAFMLIAFVIIMAVQGNGPPAGPTSTAMTNEEYWSNLRKGVSFFESGQFAEAAELWRKTTKNYNADHEDQEPRNDAEVFIRVAEVMGRSSSDEIPDVDWGQYRTKVIDQVRSVDLIPELQEFAVRIQNLCRQEFSAKKAYLEADQLYRTGDWDGAVERVKEIPATSIYSKFSKDLLDEIARAKRNDLRERAIQAGRSSQYRQAVTLANQFFSEGGQDATLTEMVEEWETQILVKSSVSEFLVLANRARSPADIKNAISRGESLMELYPNHRLILDDVNNMIKALKSKVYVLRLAEYYQAGDVKGMDDLSKKPEATDLAAAREIFQRWRQIVDMLKRADDAESRNQFEKALAIWQEVIATEPNPDNYYHKAALIKINTYNADKFKDIYMTAARDAFQNKEYYRARQYLLKADSYGAQTDDLVESIKGEGKKIFNEALDFNHTNNFFHRDRAANNALDCFLPEEAFAKRIRDRMDTWRAKRRQPKTINDQ